MVTTVQSAAAGAAARGDSSCDTDTIWKIGNNSYGRMSQCHGKWYGFSLVVSWKRFLCKKFSIRSR